MEQVWNTTVSTVLDWCGGDERLLFTVLFLLGSAGTFYLVNLVFAVFYYFDLFPNKRIPRPLGIKPESPQTIRKALIHVNAVILSSPIGMYFLYDLYKWRGMDMTAPLPGFWKTLGYLAVSLVVEDTLFYWGHRILHHPSIYKHIHKQHHQFHACVGIAALYAHPIEEVVANFIPTYSGCLISGCPLSVMVLWSFLRLWETVDAHSGYAFDWSPWNLFLTIQGGAERHDFHHFQNKGSYGSFTKFWDWVCGTDEPYYQWRREKKPAIVAALNKAKAL
ncbi:hypothetical protein PTSG_07059 [Salpingoeca rosetta]|uniref:Fatty acid hydroxylase domain-containing protein n=1 Tax=Salpingoeca rosetta (strain ATCC 50818 / BSB-021) TaxID=946362 RepID=F2UDX7_SALR5|nr:uncharacterized protein PTSG_07059 [Salpingoeca rosetta]EGD74827.1 hypothetical protein PTSG_07059 [Salpingoeca rosetta]|eukprot:XP_004992472.1 hypothetical protein PTSG_07059 [Salpingoeca rosetta]